MLSLIGQALAFLAQSKAASLHERLALDRAAEHERLVNMSYTYPYKMGRTFKCGPWRWHVYAVAGTVYRRTVKRKPWEE